MVEHGPKSRSTDHIFNSAWRPCAYRLVCHTTGLLMDSNRVLKVVNAFFRRENSFEPQASSAKRRPTKAHKNFGFGRHGNISLSSRRSAGFSARKLPPGLFRGGADSPREGFRLQIVYLSRLVVARVCYLPALFGRATLRTRSLCAPLTLPPIFAPSTPVCPTTLALRSLEPLARRMRPLTAFAPRVASVPATGASNPEQRMDTHALSSGDINVQCRNGCSTKRHRQPSTTPRTIL